MLFLPLLCSVLLSVEASLEIRSKALTISTTSGIIHGKIDSNLSNVRQFLGIPFAQAPVGALRWAPPQALSQPANHVIATQLPPSTYEPSKNALFAQSSRRALQWSAGVLSPETVHTNYCFISEFLVDSLIFVRLPAVLEQCCCFSVYARCVGIQSAGLEHYWYVRRPSILT